MILKLTDSVIQNIIKKFSEENDYFVWDEVPGWLRAHDYNIKMMADDYNFYLEFDEPEECSKFLLEWA